MRTALYVRESTGDEDSKRSLEDQEQELRDHCAEIGDTVVEVYPEAASATGSREKRTKLDAALAAAERGEFDRLMVWDGTKWSRPSGSKTAHEALGDFRALDAAGAKLYLFPEEKDLTTLDVLDMMHRAGRDQEARSRATKRGRRRAVGDHRWPGGLLPYGVTTNKDGYLVEDAQHAKAIRQGAKLLLAGKGTGEVAAEFNRQGLRTVRGTEWAAQNIRRLYRQERLSQGYIDRPGWGGKVDHPVILEPGTQRQVIAALNEAARSFGRTPDNSNKRRVYPLSGLIECPDPNCDGHWYGMPDTRTKRRQYVCSNRYRQYKKPGTCGWETPARIDAESFEQEVWDGLMSILDTDELQDAAAEALDEVGELPDLEPLRSAVSKLEDALGDADADARLDPSRRNKQAVRKLEQRLERSQGELAAAEAIHAQAQMREQTWDAYEQAAKEVAKLAKTTDPAKRRAVFHQLKVRVVHLQQIIQGEWWWTLEAELAPDVAVPLFTAGQPSGWMTPLKLRVASR